MDSEKTSRVLVGTFINYPHVSRKTLRFIAENFNPDRIFIFSVDDENTKRLVTFNVNKSDLGNKFSEYKAKYRNTLRLHRHKDSNTFYTINSLNEVVKTQNNGEKDESFQVQWEDFENSCLVIDSEGRVKSLKTKLAKIIDLKHVDALIEM